MGWIVVNRIAFALSAAFAVQNAAAEEPQWLKDARAKEGRLGQAQTIKSADGFFSAKIPVKALNEIEEDDGAYTVALDLGSSTPANCEVIRDGFDPAALLRATADLTLKEVEAIQGKVEARAVERTDAGAFGGAPFIALDWVYRVNDGKAARLGGLKQIAVVKDGYGLYCAHIELGYTNTFRQVVRSLAETLEFSERGAVPYFMEISTASIAGAKVGVAVVTMERDEEGDSRVEASTALVVPVTPDTLRTQDATHVQWVRPDGSLINASHSVSENGEVETNMQLMWGEDDNWIAKGEFNGKAVEAQIVSERDPETWVEQGRARRELFGQKNVAGRTFKAPQWTIADPTRFVEVETRIVEVLDGTRISARETLGGVTVDVILDKSTGMPSKAVAPMGAQTIELERLYVEGEF